MSSGQNTIIVDGANVAYIEASSDGDPKISNIQAVRDRLEEKGFDPIVMVDAGLRYEIDDPAQLEALIDSHEVHQAPSGTDADYFIWEIAEEHHALVVSNDEFESYRDQYPWIDDRRVPLMIVNGQVEFYEDRLQHGRA